MKGYAWPAAASSLLKESMDIVNPHKGRPEVTRSIKLRPTNELSAHSLQEGVHTCSQHNFSRLSDNFTASCILIQYFTATASSILVRYFIESDLVLSRA
jgi:hypothetical protein